jgi:hypothetical protein
VGIQRWRMKRREMKKKRKNWKKKKKGCLSDFKLLILPLSYSKYWQLKLNQSINNIIIRSISINIFFRSLCQPRKNAHLSIIQLCSLDQKFRPKSDPKL